MKEPEAVDLIRRRVAEGRLPPLVTAIWNGTAPPRVRDSQEWRRPSTYFDGEATIEQMIPSVRGCCPLFEINSGFVGFVPGPEIYFEIHYEDLRDGDGAVSVLGIGFPQFALTALMFEEETGGDWTWLAGLLQFRYGTELRAFLDGADAASDEALARFKAGLRE